jgi:hypothetical protein
VGVIMVNTNALVRTVTIVYTGCVCAIYLLAVFIGV